MHDIAPKIISFFIVSFLTYNTIYAQDPSYFVLGEAELKGADIYSILHTENEQLYVATNEGLYQYRYGIMQPVRRAQKQKGTSLFNLVSNSKNEVFCSNLNGQIFIVKNGKLNLFFEVPSKFLNSDLKIQIDNTDRLVVTSKACLLVNKNTYEVIYYSDKFRGLNANKLPNGNVVVNITGLDSILTFKNNSISKTYFKNTYLSNLPFKLVEVEKEMVSSKKLDIIVGEVQKEFNYPSRNIFEYMQFKTNEIWRRSKFGGVELLIFTKKEWKVKYQYFSNKFISEIAIGKDGVMFLGTFGQGLFVIPNLGTKNYSSILSSKNMQSLVAGDNEVFFVSDKIKGIMYFKDSLVPIHPKINYAADRLFKLKQGNANILEKFPSLFFSRPVNIGAIKNIHEVDSRTVLLASSMGITKQGNSLVLNDSLWKAPLNNSDKLNYSFKPLTNRCNDVAYDSKNNILYAATISSLLEVDDAGKSREITFNNNSIIVNDLELYNNQLWCATQNHGILILKGGEVIEHLSLRQGLGSDYVNSFSKSGNSFYISHKHGFQIYDASTKHWKNIGLAEGIDSRIIKDFSLSKDKVWFLSNDQVISMPINNIGSRKPELKIKIDSIIVNDKAQPIKKALRLEYNQNKLSFYIDFKGLLYESESYFNYQLKGFDETINSIPVKNGIITYNYLPPGDYQLNLVARCRENQSNALAYKFSISKPYWPVSYTHLTLPTTPYV